MPDMEVALAPGIDIAQAIRKLLSRLNSLFTYSVALPIILSALYFGLIASDIYISESHFFIRTPHPEMSSGIGQFLSSAGLTRAQDDCMAVQDFILSRDALARLDKKFHLSQSFSSPSIDRINRFGGLDWDTSFEALLRYYQKRVTVTIDSASSIATLHVESFDPDEAYNVNHMLLDMGEELVNQLNRRAREDMIRFAAAEVQTAETRAKEAASALSQYRNKNGIFDPKQQSGLQLQQVTTLQTGLIDAKAQLAQLQAASPVNPAIKVIRQRIETLESEIKAESAQVAGSAYSLSVHSPEYERLELDVDLAGKQLASALTTLEQAREEAIRQQLYLERIVQPNRPDVAIEPRRLKLFAATVVLGLLCWGILGLLFAGVREHRA